MKVYENRKGEKIYDNPDSMRVHLVKTHFGGDKSLVLHTPKTKKVLNSTVKKPIHQEIICLPTLKRVTK